MDDLTIEDSEHQEQRSAEQKLWGTVLHTGLEDAQRQRKKNKWGHPDVQWIESEDFAEVCWCAGFDPQVVRERFRDPRFKLGKVNKGHSGRAAEPQRVEPASGALALTANPSTRGEAHGRDATTQGSCTAGGD